MTTNAPVPSPPRPPATQPPPPLPQRQVPDELSQRPVSDELPPRLGALLAAECLAEAALVPAVEAEDLQQAVRLRWLEHRRRRGRAPRDVRSWLRAALRAEVARAVLRTRRESVLARRPQGPEPRLAADGSRHELSEVEAPLFLADRRRTLASAVALLPGRCPDVLRAMLSGEDPTYADIARELGMSQGSVGPLRSRCLQCLRRMLTAEVADVPGGGMVREATGVIRADSLGATPRPDVRTGLCPGADNTEGHTRMGMSVTITAAQRDDAEQILKLQYLCFQREAEVYGDYAIAPLTQTLDALHGELATGHVLVARLGSEIVGSVRATVDPDGTARISRLCVHPRMQRHGLGGRLLAAIEASVAAERTATRYHLVTGQRSDGNLRLYRRCGYTQVGTEKDRQVTLIAMAKDVGNAQGTGTEAYTTSA